jgi:carbonic anhydrase
MEYAVEHLHVALLVVLGHGKCGAVKAAVDGGASPGHIQSIVEALAPAVETAKTQPGDVWDNAVRANVARAAGQVKRTEPILNEAVSSGKLKVVGARYDLASGRVAILP